MQMKTTLRFCLTSVRIKGNNNSKWWWGCAETKPLYTAGGNAN
jgi:hypothetical protein